MAVKTYKYNDKTQLTEHFKVSEWKCKCGKNHEIKIDDKLPKLLETLRTKLNASRGDIYSGYRCPTHDKNVGGRGTGSHTLGYSVDIIFYDKNNKPIPSSKVALLLEDLGHQYGVAYRCGGSKDNTGRIHIDTRPRKWYGDESKSNTLSLKDHKAPSDGKTGHTTFLTYIYKPTTQYVNASILNVRNEPNKNAKVVDGIKYGSSIKVYYIDAEWAKIGVAKWVSAKYIQNTAPEKKSEVSAENNAIKEETAPKNENTVENEQKQEQISPENVEKVEESPVIDKNNEVTSGKDINVGTKEETDTNVGDYDYEDRKDANNSLFYLIDLLIEFIKKIFKR